MSQQRLEEIRQTRLAKRQALLDENVPPYPSEARRTHTIQELVESFNALQADATPVTIVGRLMALRRHGRLAFLDLADATGRFQLQANADHLPAALYNRLKQFDVGDFIQAAGKLITTERGVPTLLVDEWHILTKSLRPLPSVWYGLKDHENRFRQREVDLLLNAPVRDSLHLRSRLISWLRTYVEKAGYLEFETPMLQPLAGGTLATPFATHHQALDIPLYLRIAPELYLKRLLVAGYEKVFELGRNFRNEGIDREHNPEFTMLELYWAYADYEDLMDFTEVMLHELILALRATDEVTYDAFTLSFALPWKRERYTDVVSRATHFDILEENNPAAYVAVLEQHQLPPPAPATYAKLVDEVYKKLVRPHILQPTILYDYPVELAPLAKRNLTDPRIAEKFQVVVAGTEIVNAYSELNDPVEQRQRFAEQQVARQAGDSEAHVVDEDYLRALEFGMPPAAGWGLGVDRLVAILTDAATVRDTIAFPLMRPE